MAKETSTKLNARQEEFLKVIEAYKKQNPKKAEIKKAEFEKKLASLA